MIEIPGALARAWTHEAEWLADLPRLVAECAEQWELEPETPFESPHSLVVPAGETVLKLNAPSHVEAEHEADALELWAGRGAIRLLARDDERRALLVERCRPGTHLGDGVGHEIALGLLERLSLEAPEEHVFRLLAAEAARWVEEVPERWERAGRPFERSLLEEALDVFASVDSGARTLVNQDLHGANVLRSTREPWLVIDPKPLVGEPELAGVGLLRNAESARDIHQWLDGLAGLGLDRDRLRGWGLAHALAWGTDEAGVWAEWSIEAARSIARA